MLLVVILLLCSFIRKIIFPCACDLSGHRFLVSFTNQVWVPFPGVGLKKSSWLLYNLTHVTIIQVGISCRQVVSISHEV